MTWSLQRRTLLFGRERMLKPKAFLRCARPGLLSALFVAAAASSEPALWAASDGHATIYLFGTAHAVKPGSNWRSPALDAAIKASHRLWLEVQGSDDPAASRALVRRLGVDPAAPLATRLSSEQNARLAAVLSRLGLPGSSVAPMKPWLAGLTIAMASIRSSGLDPRAGADVTLRDLAKAEGDAVDGFDTAEQQIRYLADLPEADQIAFLDDVLRRAAAGTILLMQVSQAWEAGDAGAIDRILNAELKQRSPNLYRRLIVERNRRYADRIAHLLAGSEDQLVAVGIGHLVGRDSIQRMIEARGIKVRRLR
jgi:uncharacterized protein